MTNPEQPVAVEQVDREAAALVFDVRSRKAAHPDVATLERHRAKVIRQGDGDDYDAVQAAAIARIAAEQAQKERDARIGYVVCAEIRHVSLGDKVALAIRKGDDA